MNRFKIWKKYIKAVYCHPAYLTYTEYIMWNARIDESQAGIKISRRNINNLRCADDTTLIPESEEELESLLMRVKEESEKAGVKLNIQKTKMIAFCPITSWQIEGGKVETVTDFTFLGSKITVYVTTARQLKDAYSLEGNDEKSTQCIIKQRHYFANKGTYSQIYGFIQ